MATTPLPGAEAAKCLIGFHLERQEGRLFLVGVEGRKARPRDHTLRSLSVKNETTRPSFREIVEMRYVLIPKCWCRSSLVSAKRP